MALSHNPYDPAHAKLPLDEQREAWWRGSDDRFVKPYTEDVGYAYEGRLLEGYKSRTLDEVTWAKIAFHLAAGVPIIKIAEHYKLSRSTIWRALTSSPNLRRRVAEERALMRREADSRFVAIRELVVNTLYQAISDGNIRATIWAAERLGLGTELLQQAEKPPKPGYARIPNGWLPTPDKAAAILADLDAPPDTERPMPVPEQPPAPEPSRRRKPRPLHAHGSEVAAQTVDQMAVPADPSPTDNLPPDPIPSLPPLHADPMGNGADPLPDFPAELRSTRRRPCKVKASSPPIPQDPVSRRMRFGRYGIRPRPAIRLLAWILHNSLPLADGVDGAPGLTSARWALRPRWLAWGDKPMDL